MNDLDKILSGEEVNTIEVEATDQEVNRIADLCKKQIELEKEVDRLNELLAETQKKLSSIREHDLPDAMAEAGVSELKLKDGAKAWILNNVVKRNKDIRESAINTLKTSKMTNAQALDAMADSMVHKILINTKTDGVDPLKLLQNVAKDQLRSDKLIKTGEELPDAIKKLLGEENNLKSSVLQLSLIHI